MQKPYALYNLPSTKSAQHILSVTEIQEEINFLNLSEQKVDDVVSIPLGVRERTHSESSVMCCQSQGGWGACYIFSL